MEITWHGNSCFTFKNKDTRLVINPDSQAGKIKGEVVLNSLTEDYQEPADVERVFDWPGEYEIKNIPIVAFPAKTSEAEGAPAGDETIVFYFEIDGVKICHLGGLGHALSSETIKVLDNVDLLIIPVGERSNLKGKKLTEVLEAIDPRIVVPMLEENPAPMLKELGADDIQPEAKFQIKSAKALPNDTREYVVLSKV